MHRTSSQHIYSDSHITFKKVCEAKSRMTLGKILSLQLVLLLLLLGCDLFFSLRHTYILTAIERLLFCSFFHSRMLQNHLIKQHVQ